MKLSLTINAIFIKGFVSLDGTKLMFLVGNT